ncbi:hypothetical protein BU17DRAFT_60622 [Hysterangium stoloniferum]|nr:hypothetical protein BU17DRAFT_60622 [Hysterangium stoloniferum]
MDLPGSNTGQGSNQVGFYQDFTLQRWVQQRQALREMKAVIEEAERNMEYNLEDHIHRQNEINTSGGGQIAPQLLTTHATDPYTSQTDVSTRPMPYINAPQVIDGSTRIVEVDSVSSSPAGPSNASRSISIRTNQTAPQINYPVSSRTNDLAIRQNPPSSVGGSQSHNISNGAGAQLNQNHALGHQAHAQTNDLVIRQNFLSSLGDSQSYNISNGARTQFNQNYALVPQSHAQTSSGNTNWIPNDVAHTYIPQLTQSHMSESPTTSFPSRASQHQMSRMNVLNGQRAAPFTPSYGSNGDATGSIYFAIPPTPAQEKQPIQAGNSQPSQPPTSVLSRVYQNQIPHANTVNDQHAARFTPSYGSSGDDTGSIFFAIPPTSVQEKQPIQAGSSQPPPPPPLQDIAHSLTLSKEISAADNIQRSPSPEPETTTSTKGINTLVPVASPSVPVNQPEIQEISPDVALSAADNIQRSTSSGPETTTSTKGINTLVPVVFPSVPVNQPEIQETSLDAALSPLAAINELLADHGQWSEDASSRILQSILEGSDESPNREHSNTSQNGLVPKDFDELPGSSNVIREVLPDSQTVSTFSSTSRADGALVTPDDRLQADQPTSLEAPELPVVIQLSSPHTPAKAGPGSSVLPSSASANKDTLARDIMRALRPSSAKRKRVDSDGSPLASMPLSKKSKNALGGPSGVNMLGGDDSRASIRQEALAEPAQAASISSSEQKAADKPQLSTHSQPSPLVYKHNAAPSGPLQNQPLAGPSNYQHAPRYPGIGIPWNSMSSSTTIPMGFPQGRHPQHLYYVPPPSYPELVHQGQPPPVSRQYGFVPQRQFPQRTNQGSHTNGPGGTITSLSSQDRQQGQERREAIPINGFAPVPKATIVPLPNQPRLVHQGPIQSVPQQSGFTPQRQPPHLANQLSHANSPGKPLTVDMSLSSQDAQQGQRRPEVAPSNGFTPGPKTSTPPAPSPKRTPREPLFLPSESPPPVSASPTRPSNKIPVVELGPPLSKLKLKAHLAKSDILRPANKNGILPTGKQLYVLIPKLRGLTVAKDFKREGMAQASAKSFNEDGMRRSKFIEFTVASREKLIKHTKLIHGEGDDDGAFVTTQTDLLHLDCEFQTQLAGQLAEHIAKDHDPDYDSLSRYALPYDAELPTTPPLVDQLPAYLSVPIPVTAKRITLERHQRISPMILQRIFKKVDAKRNSTNVQLQSSRSSRLAISPEEAAQYAQDRDEYRLIRKEAPSKGFASLVQLPPFIDDVDVLEGDIMGNVMSIEHEKPAADPSISRSDDVRGVQIDNPGDVVDMGFTGLGPNLLKTLSVREETESSEVDKLL